MTPSASKLWLADRRGKTRRLVFGFSYSTFRRLAARAVVAGDALARRRLVARAITD